MGQSPYNVLSLNFKMIGVWLLSAVVLLLGVGILATVIALAQIWIEHRNDAPECMAGEPTPPTGCVTVFR